MVDQTTYPHYQTTTHTTYPTWDPWEHVVYLKTLRPTYQRINLSNSWIPRHGHGGNKLPVQKLEPPFVTAAPAPDDRRRNIRAIYTVRPMRNP